MQRCCGTNTRLPFIPLNPKMVALQTTPLVAKKWIQKGFTCFLKATKQKPYSAEGSVF